MDEPAGPAMGDALDLLWQSPALSSMEHFSYRLSPSGNTLTGTVVLLREGTPSTIRYRVSLSQDWEVRNAEFGVTDPTGDRHGKVLAEDGRWWVDGEERPDLAGCTDLDLGWTPSTNTLPIRRASLSVGESLTVRAAWVTFPDFAVKPSFQRYERIDELTWRYTSGDFIAEMATNHLGFVIRYGDDVWFTLASGNADEPSRQGDA